MTTAFTNWLDVFLAEKQVDLDTQIVVPGPKGTPNLMTYRTVVEHMKATGAQEQHQIRTVLVGLDFTNQPIGDFLKHLAGALAVDL